MAYSGICVMCCYYSLHFTDEETEAQSIYVAFFHPSSLICGTENTTSLNKSAEICLWAGGAHLGGLTLLVVK